MTKDSKRNSALDSVSVDLSPSPSYGVSPDLMDQIRAWLDQGAIRDVKDALSDLHEADVADVFNRLGTQQCDLLADIYDRNVPAGVLAKLDEPIRDAVLKETDSNQLAAAINDLDSDDAVYVIEDMSIQQQKDVLRAMPDHNRVILEELLTYPEDSAARLMQRNVVCVPSFWSIEETIEFLREADHLPDTFYNIFVVDPKHHPMGVLSLDDLLRRPLNDSIQEVMNGVVNSVPLDMDQEEVAHMFQHYSLLSAPVLSTTGRIIGMITVDDIVEVIEEEVEEDIMHLGGVGESDFNATVFKTSYDRTRWLIPSLVNTFIAAAVISYFEESIGERVALSYLMVVVAAMGGIAGMQTVTVAVRALATKELDHSNAKKAVMKELSVACMISFFFALIAGGAAGLWLQDPGLGLVLGFALICNMLWAAFAGTILPVFIHRWGMDPAISAGPILTTSTDVFGYVIFLGVATFFLL